MGSPADSSPMRASTSVDREIRSRHSVSTLGAGSRPSRRDLGLGYNKGFISFSNVSLGVKPTCRATIWPARLMTTVVGMAVPP